MLSDAGCRVSVFQVDVTQDILGVDWVLDSGPPYEMKVDIAMHISIMMEDEVDALQAVSTLTTELTASGRLATWLNNDETWHEWNMDPWSCAPSGAATCSHLHVMNAALPPPFSPSPSSPPLPPVPSSPPPDTGLWMAVLGLGSALGCLLLLMLLGSLVALYACRKARRRARRVGPVAGVPVPYLSAVVRDDMGQDFPVLDERALEQMSAAEWTSLYDHAATPRHEDAGSTVDEQPAQEEGPQLVLMQTLGESADAPPAAPVEIAASVGAPTPAQPPQPQPHAVVEAFEMDQH